MSLKAYTSENRVHLSQRCPLLVRPFESHPRSGFDLDAFERCICALIPSSARELRAEALRSDIGSFRADLRAGNLSALGFSRLLTHVKANSSEFSKRDLAALEELRLEVRASAPAARYRRHQFALILESALSYSDSPATAALTGALGVSAHQTLLGPLSAHAEAFVLAVDNLSSNKLYESSGWSPRSLTELVKALRPEGDWELAVKEFLAAAPRSASYLADRAIRRGVLTLFEWTLDQLSRRAGEAPSRLLLFSPHAAQYMGTPDELLEEVMSLSLELESVSLGSDLVAIRVPAYVMLSLSPQVYAYTQAKAQNLGLVMTLSDLGPVPPRWEKVLETASVLAGPDSSTRIEDFRPFYLSALALETV